MVRAVKTLVMIAVVLIQAVAARAQNPTTSQASPRHFSEFVCSASSREFVDRLPVTVKVKVISVDEIEVRGVDKSGRESDRFQIRRIELAAQPRTAVFSIGGMIGISGEAKILITKDALRFEEIGTAMIINQTTRDSQAYSCQKLRS